MSGKSSIEWTDYTWNPVTGCTEVSPGCDNCYARTFAERWRGLPGHHFERGFDVVLRPDTLQKPLSWVKGRRVFVNSMSDLFHKDVPDDYIAQVFAVMGMAAIHTFQVLTKRPERMRRLIAQLADGRILGKALRLNVSVRHGYIATEEVRGHSQAHPWPLRNVLLGVSIESNEYAWRADMLRQTPAHRRFLSIEPMLGPIDKVDLTGIDWVICGGESGHGARPLDLAWARELRDRCLGSGVKFFFKQVGLVRAGRGKGGDAASIPPDLMIREFPAL